MKFDFKLWNQIHISLAYKLIPMKFRNLKFDLYWNNFNQMEKMPSYTVQTGRNRPACLGLAQPLGLVAQHDGNRGRHSATAALAAVGGSGKPAPEVVVNMCCGRAAVWWTGLRRKRGRRGAHRSCPWRRLRLIGNRRWKHGPGVEVAGDWGGDGSAGSSEGPGRRCTVVPQW
jgi:hypothetical protein